MDTIGRTERYGIQKVIGNAEIRHGGVQLVWKSHPVK